MDTLPLAIADADRIDDLPRVFTYRHQRARDAAASALSPEATPLTVLDVSTSRLALFFLRCVVAALPALLLLAAVLWLAGETLEVMFPALLKMKIMIYAPATSG